MTTHINKKARALRMSVARTALALGVMSTGWALLPNQSAHAQESASSLDEIIVTARKREESLQETPVVISALSAETIADFGIDSVEAISDFTPGLVADSQGRSSGGMLFLRGIGSGSSSAAVDQAVSLVIDDMQVGTLQMQNSAMIDMEGAQVYKGPQALFFGKNSPGGVLAIKTADPGETFESQLKTGYETEAAAGYIQGIVSGPISDTTSGRLVVRQTSSDGYFDIDSGATDAFDGGKAPGKDTLFARGTLLFNPSDKLSVRSKVTYSNTDGDVSGTVNLQRVYCPNGAPQSQAGAYECKADGKHFLAPISDAIIGRFADAGLDVDDTGAWENKQMLATVSADYEINDQLSLTSVTGYYDVSSLGSGSAFGNVPAPVVAAQDLEFNQITQEIRLSSNNSGRLNYVTGLFFEDKTHEHFQPVPFPARGFTGQREYKQETTATSAFVDLTYDISETLELSGGVRYSDEEKKFTGILGYTDQAPRTESWDDVSPQVTLSWTTSNDWMVFGSYREGFKSGGFDGSFSFAPTPIEAYEPENISGFEFGAKGTLLDNKMQLSTAFFSYEYEDLQLSTLNTETLSLKIVNAAAADVSGIETDFVWMTPIDGLLARGAVTLLDTEFTDYDAPCYDGQSIAAGCNIGANDDGEFQAQDLSGEPLNLAADMVLTLGAVYEQELNSGRLLGVSVDATFTDEYETGTDRLPGTTQDSHTKLNAALTLSSADDVWSASIIGRNLTDEYTITGGGGAAGTGSGTGTANAVQGDAVGFVRPGRTIAVELTYNF